MASDNWGGWEFDGTYLEYDGYYIDVRTMTTSAQVLNWLCQIQGKSWATDAVLAGLLRAVDDLLHPQATLCGMGEHKTIDNPLLAIERLKAVEYSHWQFTGAGAHFDPHAT
jgi:hypothetical protein